MADNVKDQKEALMKKRRLLCRAEGVQDADHEKRSKRKEKKSLQAATETT